MPLVTDFNVRKGFFLDSFNSYTIDMHCGRAFTDKTMPEKSEAGSDMNDEMAKTINTEEQLQALRERAARFGFVIEPGQRFDEVAQAKPRSHEDGSRNGPFLGGLGNPMFSRSVDGHFDRWQLEPGVHLHEALEPAFIMVRWVQDGQQHSRKLQLGSGETQLREQDRRYSALFPLTFEHWQADALPADIFLTLFSPQLPADSATSAMPVTLIHVEHRAWKPSVESVSVALFWPNLMGWSMMPLTAVERSGSHWPNQTHAGQVHALLKYEETGCHLAQRIDTFDSTYQQGEVVLSAQATEAELSFHLTAKANQNETGVPYSEQPYTLAWLESQLLESGRFSNDDTQWHAHWHEPLMSAIAARFQQPGAVTFGITLDWPRVRFGQGRLWWRAYTKEYGQSGRVGSTLADTAHARLPAWLAQIDQWQRSVLPPVEAAWSVKVAGAIVNEYWSIPAGSAVWVNQPVSELPAHQQYFRQPEHFAWLEGFDSGYFYYNTLDLYVYAFAGLNQLWPDLAQSVFDDYKDTATLQIQQRRPVYRQGDMVSVLADGKLPHDLGSPSADPWVALNGYVMRDDPNVWKDHNPSFIVSYYLHKTMMSQSIDSEDLPALRSIADFIERQTSFETAIPIHQEFGDSTWDNLDMRGLSSYTGSWVMAAWAVMARVHQSLGNSAESSRYQRLLENAQRTFESLWSGQNYRTNSEGKYANATQCDALIGIYYARLAGLGDLLPPERVCQHLETVWQNNVVAYREGRFGPLLIAEPGRQRFERDGGEELQVNEVLVGSAWVYIGMLAEYGLTDKARTLAENMVSFQYRRSGLQFRTPAAWDADGHFRAPLNMRPLSIALLRNQRNGNQQHD